MRVTVSAQGLLEPGRFADRSAKALAGMRRTVARVMQEESGELVEAVRDAMRSGFTVRQAKFLRAMGSVLYAGRDDRFPALYIRAHIPWLRIHASGGKISKKLLIPILDEHRRIGPKAFRRVITGLIDTGNAFFIKKDGKIILMAENIAENDRELARFKRAEKKRSGQKNIERGAAVPVAVLVNSVTLRARFDAESAVRGRLPHLARAIEAGLAGHGI